MSKREKDLLTRINVLLEERRVDQLEISNLKCQVETLLLTIKGIERSDCTLTPPADLWPEEGPIYRDQVEAAV